MILNTERLRLRPLNPGDARAVHLMMSDAEVMAYWDVSRVEDPAVTGDIVQRQLAEAAADRAAHWAMERLDDRGFVGVCDLSEIDWRHARAEVGFLVGRAFWGEGYTFEAMHAVIGHAAAEGDVDDANAGLVQRLGLAQDSIDAAQELQTGDAGGRVAAPRPAGR